MYSLHVRIRILKPSVTSVLLVPLDTIIITMFHPQYKEKACMIFRRGEKVNFIYTIMIVLPNRLLQDD